MEESGVPLDALRKKYASLARERDAALEAAMAGSDIAEQVAFDASRLPSHSEFDGKAHRDALKSLRICPACKGLGIASSVYNHMVISRTCAPCDGDGVIRMIRTSGDQRESAASISTTLVVAAGSTAPAALTEAASAPPPLE